MSDCGNWAIASSSSCCSYSGSLSMLDLSLLNFSSCCAKLSASCSLITVRPSNSPTEAPIRLFSFHSKSMWPSVQPSREWAGSDEVGNHCASQSMKIGSQGCDQPSTEILSGTTPCRPEAAASTCGSSLALTTPFQAADCWAATVFASSSIWDGVGVTPILTKY